MMGKRGTGKRGKRVEGVENGERNRESEGEREAREKWGGKG